MYIFSYFIVRFMDAHTMSHMHPQCDLALPAAMSRNLHTVQHVQCWVYHSLRCYLYDVDGDFQAIEYKLNLL